MKSLRACILSIPRISLIQTRLYAISVLSNRSAFFNPVDPRVKAHRYVRFLHSTRFSPEPLGSDSLLSNPEEEVNPATEVQVRNSSDTTWISATSSVSTDKTLGADGRILSGLVIEPSELPLSCPGCGAYSQLSAADEPGYYSAERNDVQLWLAKQKDVKSSEDEEVEIVARSLASIDSTLLGSFGISEPDPSMYVYTSRLDMLTCSSTQTESREYHSNLRTLPCPCPSA